MYQKLVQSPAFSTMMQDAGGVNINKNGGGGGAGGAAAFGRAMRGRRAGGVHPTEKVTSSFNISTCRLMLCHVTHKTSHSHHRFDPHPHTLLSYCSLSILLR